MLRSRSSLRVLNRVAAMAGGAIICVAAVVGCGGSDAVDNTDGAPKTTAIDTKGAAAKDAKLPKGVFPAKGKFAPPE